MFLIAEQYEVEISSNTAEKRDYQPLTDKIILQTFLNANEGMTIDLPEIGLNNVIVRRKLEGRTADFDEYPLSVYIISDYCYGSSDAMHDS